MSDFPDDVPQADPQWDPENASSDSGRAVGIARRWHAGEFAGVHRWADAPEAETFLEAASENQRVIVVDCSTAVDKSGFMLVMATAIDAPEYFGRNWDALAECLVDLDAGGGLLLLLTGWQAMAEGARPTLQTAIEVLAQASESWADSGGGGVLLLGPGPDLGLSDVSHQ